MTAGSERLWGQLTALLACANDLLVAAGRPVGRVQIAPGTEAAWDDCCDGQLWVRAVRLQPAIQHPNCGIDLMGATVELGILRCAQVVDDNGVAPSPVEVTVDAGEAVDDAHLMLEAIACCWAAERRLVTEWTPLGVSGGCSGGAWTATFVYDPCLCQING